MQRKKFQNILTRVLKIPKMMFIQVFPVKFFEGENFTVESLH